MAIRASIPMQFGGKIQEDYSLSIPKGDAGYYFGTHWHDCFEILHVRDGSFIVHLAEETLKLSVGDVMVIPPHMLHSTENPPGAPYEVVVFGYTEEVIATPELSFANLKYLLPFRCTRPIREWCICAGRDDTVRDRLAEVVQSIAEVPSPHPLLVRSAILRLHAALYAHYLPGTALTENAAYIAEVERYIEEHLSGDISPYAIADALHVSYSHLARIVKHHFGFSIGELICRMRINVAEQWMAADPSRSVTDIAMQLGFGSTGYFIRQFTRLRGCPPGAFRRMLAGVWAPHVK